MMGKRSVLLAPAIAGCPLVFSTVRADVITAAQSGSGDIPTIQGDIIATGQGDILDVARGFFPGIDRQLREGTISLKAA